MIYLHFKWGGGYTKSEIDTLLNGKSDTSHTHTKSQITDFPSIPSKTSDLTNDSGFLTSHQDLSGYIPLSGTNALSGSIVPDTDVTYNLGDSSHAFKTGFLNDIRSLKTTETIFGFYNDGADLVLCPYGYNNGRFILRCYNGTNRYALQGSSDGTLTWGSKNVAMQEDTVPRSGGAVFDGSFFARTVANSELQLCGGPSYNLGAYISLIGKNNSTQAGQIIMVCRKSDSSAITMFLYPNGTWTWQGQAVQLISDQRLKQQITEIDDKLLDAWQDVDLVQFKYNEAVEEKGDNARLHTGYVVQQINEACQKHNIDISEYGLYCHEEYPERTEEVEVTQDDGSIKKETKVIEEASEHYSLRYTETLVVECAYLRRENARLKERLQRHDDYFSNIEKRLQSLENS